MITEFSAGRSLGDAQCYVYDAFNRQKIALIPMDIGEMSDQWRIASRIGQALSREAGRVRREGDVWLSGFVVGVCAAVIIIAIAGAVLVAMLS